jgi:hypothetical protein
MSRVPALPDTALVREALVVARRALPASIVDHSRRTFLLAEAYAAACALDHDPEGLCLAAIFHDLGLGKETRVPGIAFTIASSREMTRFLEERQVPQERIAPLVEAIELHMQLFPRWSKGNVVGLLQVGAWMDVYGLRRGRISAEAAEIARAIPRDGFAEVFNGALRSTLTTPTACLGLLFPKSFRGRDHSGANARPA